MSTIASGLDFIHQLWHSPKIYLFLHENLEKNEFEFWFESSWVWRLKTHLIHKIHLLVEFKLKLIFFSSNVRLKLTLKLKLTWKCESGLSSIDCKIYQSVVFIKWTHIIQSDHNVIFLLKWNKVKLNLLSAIWYLFTSILIHLILKDPHSRPSFAELKQILKKYK